MYSPKIREDYIPKLFRLARYRNIPMTRLVNEIVGDYFERLRKATLKLQSREITRDLLSKRKRGDKNEQPINSRTGLPDTSDKKVIPLSSHSQ